MKISFLSPNLSNNGLVRPYILAKILQRRHQVEIVGPQFGDGIWEPVRDLGDLTYRSVPLAIGSVGAHYAKILGLTRHLDGDLVWAHKPLFASFGNGILQKIRTRCPLLLDIEDWQLGFLRYSRMGVPLRHRLRRLVVDAIELYDIASYWATLLGEAFSFLADGITVSNRFLQRRFGGTIVWHARDTSAFDPRRFDGAAIREEHGIEAERRVVLFSGTPRAYKGIEDLVTAMAHIDDPDALLVVAGVNPGDAYSQQLLREGARVLGSRFLGIDTVSFEKAPSLVAMADLVAVPQRRNLATVGQIPAKIFDGMAMAKPVVSTQVCDIPELLDGCGWVVEPGRPRELAAAIEYVLAHPEEARDMGLRAREKCLREYSYDAMEKVLAEVISPYA